MEFAIVGASIRLPGVADLDQFGDQLLSAQSGLRAVSREESLRAGLSPNRVASPRYVARASVIEDAECFDNEFFAISAGEAASIDPQHRLLLTLSYEALESSGLDPRAVQVGAYVSTTISSTYLGARAAADHGTFDYQPLLGNDKDFSGVRVAHKLGLTGPAVSVQSACSSSLVAVHQACAALAYGDAEAALAGGVSLSIPQSCGYLYQDGGVLSPTGECRPFDADSNGTIKGNGGAVVVLRRLEDALAAGDEVLAVLSGTAVNNDGSQRMAFTAPSPVGQQSVLAMALRRAGISAQDVRYIETHGTGTQLGDPIEYKALRTIYSRNGRAAAGRCYLGSLKSSYGHLDAAAGIVGLLKTVLVTRHGQVFPQANFTAPNPHIDLASTRFAIASRPEQFPRGGYAAVSAFGMGGTNAHAVLRALRPDERSDTPPPGPSGPHVLQVRARTAQSVVVLCASIAQYLHRRRDVSVADVAATLRRRTISGAAFQIVATTIDELIAALLAVRRNDIQDDTGRPDPPENSGRQIWLPPTPLEPVPVASSPAGSGVSTAPPADVSGTLRTCFLRLVRAELGRTVDEDTDFFAAGGESIALVDIVAQLTEQYGFAADFEHLDGLSTVGAILQVLQRQAGAADDAAQPLLPFGPPSTVYFHPPAGGTNFCYTALHRAAPDVGFHAFRTRLHEDGRSIETIAGPNIAI
ncbi:MAG: beta-ketoacyl synthase N-terminal-like domain-containing protein, partial [Mycobacterium sp.]